MGLQELQDLHVASGKKLYVVAAAVGVNPTLLGQMLKGRKPMKAEVSQRLQRLLQEPKK